MVIAFQPQNKAFARTSANFPERNRIHGVKMTPLDPTTPALTRPTEMSGQQFLTYGDAAVWTTNHYNVASAWYEMSDNRTEIKYEINYYYGTFPNAEEIIGVGAWWSETQPSKVADIKQKQVAPFIRDTGNYLTYQTTITGLSADTNYYVGFYLIFSDGVVWYNIKDAKYTGDE
jgi:hypothetical protein